MPNVVQNYAAVMETGVCLEVVEAVTIFLSQLHAHMRHVEISIGWNMPSSGSQANVETCTVEAHGLGAYYLDGVLFLQTLYVSSPCFQNFIQHQTWSTPPVQLVSRRIGDHTSMTHYSVEGLQDSSRLVVMETVQSPLSPSLPTTSMAVILLVNARWEEMQAEVTKLSCQLHLLHVINPEVCFKVGVSVGKQLSLLTEYKAEVFKSLFRTPFKLATSLHHYQLSRTPSSRRGRLRLFKGNTVELPSCVPPSEQTLVVDLQVSCAVALVPPSPLRAGRKLPARQSFSHIHVSMFGPSMVPLILARSDLPPALLAEWGQYGITPEPSSEEISGNMLVPGLQFKVAAAADRKQVLLVLVFFEEVGVGAGHVVGENKHWARHMHLLRAVRSNLTSLLSVHSARFHKAVHSALDKLICNYAVYAELRSRVDRAVLGVAEAVSSIAKHSTRQHFKHECRQLLQLREEDADDIMESILVDKLSELAKTKLDLGPDDFPYASIASSNSTSGSLQPSQDVSSTTPSQDAQDRVEPHLTDWDYTGLIPESAGFAASPGAGHAGSGSMRTGTDASTNRYEVDTRTDRPPHEETPTHTEDEDLHFRDLESIDTPVAVGDDAGGQELPSQRAGSQEAVMPGWSQEIRLSRGTDLDQSQSQLSEEEATSLIWEGETPQTVIEYNSKAVSEEDFVWDLS